MKRRLFKLLLVFFFTIATIALFYAVFTIFFDQAVFMRKGTFYLANVNEKVTALTFDDGPSLEWTPKILDELKKANVKATFFMLGKHVQQYPDIVKRVLEDGHEIGNHTFSHPNLIFANDDELKREILDTEDIIKKITNKPTKLFRPPKAWLTKGEKKRIKNLGYTIVLWTLNSKDWVTFDDKYMVRYIVKNISPGDIVLFHDSGGVFSTEGGDRHETVKTMPRLIEKLREKGYRFVTISELLELERKNGNEQQS